MRSIAVSRSTSDKLYEGTLDGRLIALDKRTGTILWSTQTTDVTQAYSITSAPRIAKGMVIIGNAGAEYGVRGYISAYDAETGKMAWRFYTVPAIRRTVSRTRTSLAPRKPGRAKSGRTAEAGTPWDGIGYDPALDLLYFGTGNATAWYRALRGGGDNLYTACIVAVHASTGELAWYFQPTPGDNWDYDATQTLMQADLKIGGRVRNVLMQANKNGFFYVLDRKTGEFISGAPFVSRHHVGHRARPEDRPPDRDSRHGWSRAHADLARSLRRAQLVSHGLPSGDRTGLCSGKEWRPNGSHARFKMEI